MSYRIPFNIPPFLGKELDYIRTACETNRKICGDGPFTARCTEELVKMTGAAGALLTTSCTHALEMGALMSEVGAGDEVIMPSYTFVSTANAFVLRGAVPVFVDIRPDTMNIDENLIEAAITERTRAIAVVHYAGVACEMDTIMRIAGEHKLTVVEDAAQAVRSSYKGKALGSIGNYGAFSFHETKNYSCGEGGAFLFRDPDDRVKAEILREKGTNRSQYYRGQVDKYTWMDHGSSYLPSELNAAYLLAQLEEADMINDKRLMLWERYHAGLKALEERERIRRPIVPEGCRHNAHMYYMITGSLEERTALIEFLKERGILAVFHYVPLHTAPASRRFGRFHGEDRYTTALSERLVRLPMYYDLTPSQADEVLQAVEDFYAKN
ncbi:MAG: dTDP-4-amino-4,6-dideoxygalactose transaminase [Lachnospiraceae bacterium]|nr:dTDP-4-amino-4,6-dideoxygalactose transaminase [Lachnospiraceae bacterium]